MLSAYDRAAIKFRGVEADINFNIEDYEEDLKQVSHQERGRENLWKGIYLISNSRVIPYLLQFLNH